MKLFLFKLAADGLLLGLLQFAGLRAAAAVHTRELIFLLEDWFNWFYFAALSKNYGEELVTK